MECLFIGGAVVACALQHNSASSDKMLGLRKSAGTPGRGNLGAKCL